MTVSGTVEIDVSPSRGEFLLCVSCRYVHRISEADRAPLFEANAPAPSTDDFAAFLATHGSHRLTLLERTGDRELHSAPRWDPMARTVWEASDGLLTYLVTASRPGADGPRLYRARRGRLLLVHETASLDHDALARLVDDALYPLAAPASRISALLEALDGVVRAHPLDDFPVVEEDRRDPNVLLAFLPGDLGPAIATIVDRFFEGEEADRLTNLFENDLRSALPIVRIERRFIARVEE